ncbi:G-PROTEIN-RECEP-F1-2 domain-containing protein [Aphelenchoides besseyi]|nr:G-PROTEIN-RECEP-F1-2 domain-containing protein [Aphelenchoides besseyi]
MSLKKFVSISDTKPNLTGVSVHMEPPLIYYKIIELPVLLLGFACSFVFVLVMYRARCFHQNLRIILISYALSLLGLCTSRLMIISPLLLDYGFGLFVDNEPLCRSGKTLHDFTAFMLGTFLLPLLIERTIATVNARIYELCTKSSIGMLLLGIQVTAGIAMVYMNQTYAVDTSALRPCLREYVNKYVFIVVIVFVIIINSSGIFFVWLLLYVNKRRYMTQISPLGERYQLCENIRSMKMLFPIAAAYLTIIIVASSLLLVQFIIIPALKSRDIIARSTPAPALAFDLMVAFQTIIIPFVAFHWHRVLRLLALNIVYRQQNRVGYIVDNKNEHKIVGLNGESLVALSSSEETQIYFNELAKMWS